MSVYVREEGTKEEKEGEGRKEEGGHAREKQEPHNIVHCTLNRNATPRQGPETLGGPHRGNAVDFESESLPSGWQIAPVSAAKGCQNSPVGPTVDRPAEKGYVFPLPGIPLNCVIFWRLASTSVGRVL